MYMPTIDVPITTIEAILALPEDGQRHEFLEGVHTVTPSPAVSHQMVVTNIFSALLKWASSNNEFLVMTSPADLRPIPNTLVQPDIFVVRPGTPTISSKWADLGLPVLVIEILSPGTARRDRGKKRQIYQKAGIAEYWIIDIDSRLVERWKPDDDRPEIISNRFTWLPDRECEELDIDVSALFQRLPTQDT
jgi:Uma2 family endonuclease